jgi:hypothetical protein
VPTIIDILLSIITARNLAYKGSSLGIEEGDGTWGKIE